MNLAFSASKCGAKQREETQKRILVVLIPNMPISMDHRSISLVPSCLSRQDASNDTLDHPSGPTLQSDPGQGSAILVIGHIGHTVKVTILSLPLSSVG